MGNHVNATGANEGNCPCQHQQKKDHDPSLSISSQAKQSSQMVKFIPLWAHNFWKSGNLFFWAGTPSLWTYLVSSGPFVLKDDIYFHQDCRCGKTNKTMTFSSVNACPTQTEMEHTARLLCHPSCSWVHFLCGVIEMVIFRRWWIFRAQHRWSPRRDITLLSMCVHTCLYLWVSPWVRGALVPNRTSRPFTFAGCCCWATLSLPYIGTLAKGWLGTQRLCLGL